ncbi:MAG TPA: alpha/beta hydrolase [Bryobacteraceae bacterium]|nr:alpha/beta hydrolase [Bryobacteraceae bacterium]
MKASRRSFLQAAAVAAGVGGVRADSTMQTIQTPVLNIAYEEQGDPRGFPVVLLHGFPDDAHAWDRVAPPLAQAGYRVLVPYLRGYGPTRFRDRAAPRMAEQAAIGQDVLDFADALKLPRIALAGYDWGGRAAAILAALHPERVRAAAFLGGYLIQNTLAPPRPAPPEVEREFWYQWYFNTERGRLGLAQYRRSLCRLLWQTWSPGWNFSDAEYNLTAPSFDNPDFVDVVIHSYRHRNGNAPGEERFKETERKLAERPPIPAPTVLLYGARDALVHAGPEETPAERAVFPALVARRVVAGGGHFLPREKPEAVSAGLLEVLAASR